MGERHNAKQWPNRWLFRDKSHLPAEDQALDILYDIRLGIFLILGALVWILGALA